MLKLSGALLCVAAGWAVYDKLKLRRRRGEKWTQSSELTLGDAPPVVLSGMGPLQTDLICRVQPHSAMQQLQLCRQLWKQQLPELATHIAGCHACRAGTFACSGTCGKSLPTHLVVCSVQNKEVTPTLHGDLQSTHSKPSLLQGSS